MNEEIARWQCKVLAQRIHRARFEEPTILEDFHFDFNPKLPAAQIRHLASCESIEEHESVILYAPVGAGKTHVAQGLGHMACQRGFSVVFAKTSRLLREMAGGHAPVPGRHACASWPGPTSWSSTTSACGDFTVTQADDFYELVLARPRTCTRLLRARWRSCKAANLHVPSSRSSIIVMEATEARNNWTVSAPLGRDPTVHQ